MAFKLRLNECDQHHQHRQHRHHVAKQGDLIARRIRNGYACSEMCLYSSKSC
jgi:hypothetical protein